MTVKGNAAISIRKADQSCPQCSIKEEDFVAEDTLTMQVYGVDIVPDPSEIMVPVDEEGYSICPVSIGYTIFPSEYHAGNAYVIVYEDQRVVMSMPSETKGKGAGVLSKGFWFNPEGEYEAEVVLNIGAGEPLEIRSERIPLRPGGIRIESILIEGGAEN